MYYPVLKLSNAEMGALANLKDETKTIITPIIESKVIQANKVDDWQSVFRTLGIYLSTKIGRTKFIYDFYSAFENIGEVQELIDEKDRDNIVKHCMKKLDDAQLNYIPCLHFDSPEWMIDSVLLSTKAEIAIRIRCNDFSSSLEDMISERIVTKIIHRDPEKKYIILLDYFDSPINHQRIKNSIKTFSKMIHHKLVLILTSCPETSENASPNTFSIINSRSDIKTYMNLKKDYPRLQFGDYTVRLKPKLEMSYINYYNTYLKIFYSTEDDYYIGKSTLLERDGVNTFIEICQEIVESDVYKGPEFSAGDRAIFECAKGQLTINNHLKPIEYGINHHIELTSRQVNVGTPVFSSF